MQQALKLNVFQPRKYHCLITYLPLAARPPSGDRKRHSRCRRWCLCRASQGESRRRLLGQTSKAKRHWAIKIGWKMLSSEPDKYSIYRWNSYMYYSMYKWSSYMFYNLYRWMSYMHYSMHRWTAIYSPTHYGVKPSKIRSELEMLKLSD